MLGAFCLEHHLGGEGVEAERLNTFRRLVVGRMSRTHIIFSVLASDGRDEEEAMRTACAEDMRCQVLCPLGRHSDFVGPAQRHCAG